MHFFKTFFVYIEIAIVVGVVSYFAIEGFPKNNALTAILFIFGASSFINLVGYFWNRENKNKE